MAMLALSCVRILLFKGMAWLLSAWLTFASLTFDLPAFATAGDSPLSLIAPLAASQSK
jgi:hypothetical protein